MQRASRLQRELQLLNTEPPSGATCWQHEDKIDDLRAQVVGSSGSPYEGGVFNLAIRLPQRYPFEPPHIRFLTPIYHPNIDNAGRICLDILKMPPKGAWRPALNISTVLTSIQLLMSEPNPDDPLMADIVSFILWLASKFIDQSIQLFLGENIFASASLAKTGEITEIEKFNRSLFLSKARKLTEQHAMAKVQATMADSKENAIPAEGTSQKRKGEELSRDPKKMF